jgi:hypothetical protein
MDPVEQYLQGLLTIRRKDPEGNPLFQRFYRNTPFTGTEVVPPATRELAEEIVNRLTVSPGQFTIPGINEYLPNSYRPGATIRATGPGMVGNPQLNRFAEVPETIMQRVPVSARPRSRGTAAAVAGGIAAGAAVADYLSNPALQKNVNNEAAYIRDAILSGRIPYSPF